MSGEPEQRPNEPEATDPPSLNKLNWLNLVSYILNFAITYGVGTLGWLGNGTNPELSEKYQTLVTPNASAFSIWAVIFITQAIFVILQLLPGYRSKEMVQNGVGYYYVCTCLFQVFWTLTFAYEAIWVSLIFMLLIWGSLLALLYSQYYTEAEGTITEFWLLRFPFALHCGWVTAASALNVNVVAVYQNAPAATQLAVGILSLAVLHAISVWVLFGIHKANFTLAGVLSWAKGWIYNELQSPKDSIIARFSADTISGVSYAAISVSIIITLQIVVRVVYDVVQSKLKEESSEDSITAMHTANVQHGEDDTAVPTTPYTSAAYTPQKPPSTGNMTEIMDTV